jgi:hypothetical protein
MTGTVASLFVGNQNGWVTVVKEKAKYLVEEFFRDARHAGFITLKYGKKKVIRSWAGKWKVGGGYLL